MTFTRPVFLFKIDHDDGTTTGILSHALGRYEQSNDQNLIYRHRGNYCTNCVLVFAFFTIILLVFTSTTNFYRNLQKIFFRSTSIRKCHMCLKTNRVHFVVAQFHSKKAMIQSPCFDIEYWGSYGPFHLSGAKWKYLHRITITFLIFNRIIFHLNGFQPHHQPFILPIHAVIFVHCSLFTPHVNIFHHRRLTFFFKIFGSNVVSVVYSWIYQFFSFFPSDRF